MASVFWSKTVGMFALIEARSKLIVSNESLLEVIYPTKKAYQEVVIYRFSSGYKYVALVSIYIAHFLEFQ